MDLKMFLNMLSAVFGAASAFCWWKSATVQVKHQEQTTESWAGDIIIVDGNDHIATLKAQGLWNKKAAATATATAVCQAVLAGIEVFGKHFCG
jgi:hypothetical protein